MKNLIFIAALLLGACSGITDREYDLCDSATEGLSREEYGDCVRHIGAMRYDAWQEALQKFRNKPRPKAVR